MTKIIFEKIFKREISYILIFFVIYLAFFVNAKSGMYFLAGFLYVYIFSVSYSKLKKYFILFPIFYLVPLITGYFYGGLYEIVGFLIGTSVASFVLLNRQVTKDKEGSSIYINSALVGQLTFTFFYFYKLVIQDVRGQNKLDIISVGLGLGIFYFASTIILPLIIKILQKRLDTLSTSNIILILNILIITGSFYLPFLEVGSFNVILPASFLAGVTAVFYFFSTYKKHFKFKRTITTIVFTGIPLIFAIYYPWNISKFLGSMFAAVSIIALFSVSSVSNNLFFKNKFTGLSSATINIYLFLMSLFFLSSKGIITKINIAEINYLIAVLFGVVLVILFEEIRDSAKIFIKKLKFENIYSVFLIIICVLISYVTLDIGGVETLGSLLFGIIGYLLIKNNTTSLNLNESNTGYVYLENNLLNLLTVFSLSLILTKL